MPETATAVAAFLESASVAEIVAAAFPYVQGAAVVYGLYQTVQARRQAQNASLEWQGQQITIRGTDVPAAFQYGRCRPTALFTYAKIIGAAEEYATFVYILGFHEFDAIEQVLLNGEPITLGPGLWNGQEILTDELVQPGSKWYTSRETESTFTATWPAAGGTITLPHEAVIVSSIVMPDGTPNEPPRLVQDLHWTASVTGTGFTARTVITAVANTGGTGIPPGSGGEEFPGAAAQNRVDLTGRQVVITYRHVVGNPLVRVKRFLGSPSGQRDLDLEDATQGQWAATDDHRELPGLHITFKWDREVFGASAMPEVSAIVRGKKVRDWVTGTTSWSNNAARCVADYLMSPYGMQVPLAEINAARMIASQNACDEQVPVSATENESRYTIDGPISTSSTIFDNLRTMLAAMAGWATWSGGEWLVHAGVYSAPVYTLGDVDFANGPKRAVPATALRSNYNTVTGRFIDPQYYQALDFKPYQSATYLAQDGGEPREQSIDLPLTASGIRAQRIAKQFLFRVRNAYTWSAVYNFGAYPLQPGDRVYLKHKRRGWHLLNGGLGKVFLVQSRKLQTDGTIAITFAEDAAAFYAWDYNEGAVPDPSPNTGLPDPTFVEPIEGLTVTTDETTYRTSQDGLVVPFAIVRWLPHMVAAETGAHIRVQWKFGTQTDYDWRDLPPDATSFEISPVARGDVLNIVLYARNAWGVVSAGAFATHLCSYRLPSNRAPGADNSGANLLADADWGIAVGDWDAYQNDCPDPIGFALASDAHRLQGTPASTILFQNGGSPLGAPYVRPKRPFPMTPGRRYACFASLMPVACDGQVGVGFLREDGSPMFVQYADTWVAAMDDDPLNRDAFKRSFVIVVAPAEAKYGVFAAYKTGTKAGLQSGMRILEPMACEISLNATELPRWSPGPSGSIDSGRVPPEAFTIPRQYKQTQTSLAKRTTISVDSDTFTVPVPCKAVLSAAQTFVVQRASPDGVVQKDGASVVLYVITDGGLPTFPGDGTGHGAQSMATGGEQIGVGQQFTCSGVVPYCEHPMVPGRTYKFRMVVGVTGDLSAPALTNGLLGVQILLR